MLQTRLFLLLPWIACAAMAGETHPWRFGLAVQANLAASDLDADSKGHGGFGLSALASYQLRSGHVLRPRLDIDSFRLREQHDDATRQHDETLMSRFGAGLDYLYYPRGNGSRGLFLSAGLGLHRWQLDDQHWHHQGPVTTRIQTTTLHSAKLSAAAGLGFQFNPVTALEVRASSTGYDRPSHGPLADANGDRGGTPGQGLMIQLAGSFRW